ncbi:MAG: PP2C family protein-serine/threonine phosphatase [Acidobacteriota bacterium]
MKKEGTTGLTTVALERILQVTRQLAAPFELAEMLSSVVEAGKSVLGAERGTVFLYQPETDELISTVATGMDVIRVPADCGIVGQCLQSREVVNVPDCYADSRFNRAVDRESGFRTRCLLAVPLIGQDDSRVGVLELLNKENGTFTEYDEKIARTLAAQCAVAIQRVRMTQDLLTKERLDRELEVARAIQMGVLPKKMPVVAGYDLAGFSLPADQTGGDIFDLIPLDEGRLLVLLGDATGHGLGPALSVTQVRAMLRMAVRLGAGLDSTYLHINNQLVEDLADNRFVTAFFGLLDAKAHRVSYHAGGQAPLLHYHAASGECEWRGASTTPMGFMAQHGLTAPAGFDLAPGDILGLITDGVFECQNTSSEAFEQARVGALVRQHRNLPMNRLIEIILRKVQEFGGSAPQADDITLVLIRRLPGTGFGDSR